MKSSHAYLVLIFNLLLFGCISSDAQSVSKSSQQSFSLPAVSQQVVVGVTEDWNSSSVTLQLYELKGNTWVAAGEAWKGRLGRNGSNWGIGLHPVQAGDSKREGDGRTPAGIFQIGGAMGYAANCQRKPSLPYRQITTRDLWVEDTESPHYNKHLILDHEPKTEWEKKAQMRQGDHAHSLKLFIEHNSGAQTVPGKGSSIFFHIWRADGAKPTAGCTTMSESNLRKMISSIDPDKNPTYVILPKAEYEKFKGPWKLPYVNHEKPLQ